MSRHTLLRGGKPLRRSQLRWARKSGEKLTSMPALARGTKVITLPPERPERRRRREN
jgi:hypothetical protein